MKNLICICCPRGCHLEVDEVNLTVKGNSCPRGKDYGIAEVTNPTRVVTSTVKITNAIHPRVPVKTDKPIAKGKIFDVMKELNKVVVSSPVKTGDVVIHNVCGTDVNIIITKDM